jgi:hypothetical protein
MEEILRELKEIRALLGGLQLSQELEVQKCCGITGKGVRCANKALRGSEYCGMHSGETSRPVPRPKKKIPKPKKIQPEHTHPLGESPGEIPCPLCETHGDVWDPNLTECLFVGNLSPPEASAES